MSESAAGSTSREAPARKGRDVFISYSRHDKRTADAVCAALEAEGIPCWIGPRDTQAGAYGRSIMEAIRSARMLVLILSQHADRTPNVLTEVAEAFDRKLPILPFRLANFAASDEMRFYIRTWHWIDAFPETPEQHIPELVERVKVGLGSARSDAEKPAETHPGTVPPPATAQRKRRGITWAFTATAGALGIGISVSVTMMAPQGSDPGRGLSPGPSSPVTSAEEDQGGCKIGDCWGAVAFGPGGAWAYAVNYSTRDKASAQAQRRCAGRCSRVLTFHNTCGAYASGTSDHGWATGSSREEVQGIALAQCRSRTQECVLKVWGCTSR